MTKTSHRPSAAETVAEWNEVTGLRVDEAVIVGALEDLRTQGWLSEPRTGLTRAEVDYLEQHGGVTDDRAALVGSRVAAAVRDEAAASETLTVEQASELMRVSTSRVRHRIKEGSLYAYPSRGRGVSRRVPSWQFDGREPAPHLAAVLDALPERYRPSDVRAFALNAAVDDPDNGVSVPLLAWLHDGGDPELARALAASEARLV